MPIVIDPLIAGDSKIAAILVDMRSQLQTLPGLMTCKVGLEANMTPGDYPMIRIVPSRISPARAIGRRRLEVLIYFGTPVHEWDSDPNTGGLEALYEALFDIESMILQRINSGGMYSAVYLDTVMDEDRSDAYKLMAMRFDVEG